MVASPCGCGPVAGDVHQRRAVAQRAELVRGGEAGAGVGGLVADGPVVLGGVPDRLVDGQPQVGRVDHQVVAAGGDAGRLRLLGQQLGQLASSALEVPAVAGQVLPAAAGRRGQRVHRLEPAGGPVDRGGGQRRRDPDPLLDGRGAGQVGVELVLPHHGHPGLHVVDAVGGQQPPRPVGEQRHLVPGRHRERVDRVVGDPHRVAVHRLVGPLHPLRGHRGQRPGHRHRLLGGGRRPLRGQLDVRGEAPDAVDDHPHGQPDGGRVGDVHDHPVAQRQRLPGDPLHPQVGVLGAELAGPAQRGVGQRGERQGPELGVDALAGSRLTVGSIDTGQSSDRRLRPDRSPAIRSRPPVGDGRPGSAGGSPTSRATPSGPIRSTRSA